MSLVLSEYWHRPSGGWGRLAVMRYNATRERKGVLFVNAGVLPGTDIKWFSNRAQAIANDLVDGSYDIVSWDVRGMRKSDEDKEREGGFYTIPTSPSCFPDEKAEDNFHRQQVNRLMNMHSADTPWSRPGSNVIGQNYYNKYLSTAAYNQECISYQSSTSEVPYFSYMGTAASARDLVALADHLQGPGTPINFWGFSHGSLIGSYLVNMFPERVGRIILDSPIDPRDHISRPSHLGWEEDMTHANETFTTFGQNYAEGRCQLIRDDFTSPDVHLYPPQVLALARVLFNEFHARANVDYHYNPALRNFANLTYNSTNAPPLDFINWTDTLHNFHDEFYKSRLVATTIATLCGDRVDDHPDLMNPDEESLINRIMEFSMTTPLLEKASFPTAHYLCHLWPMRAVEVYPGPWDNLPANPVLVIGNKLNPFSSFKNAKAVANLMGKRGILVEQEGFGYSLIPHTPNRDVAKIVSRYLRDGVVSPSHWSSPKFVTHAESYSQLPSEETHLEDVDPPQAVLSS
ncbi:hypothetical protein NLI96_g2283 [Meripilus lineatus]|uniref:AB hydrolase-1 domain-containing protein n=1 Tax=Meripilus lineatus TaxID=2056292 RepID=A0AAD5VAJ9_9APHY|nr:hypothetical protein NLI96_g2283 [Physisporinus lineatus]